MSYHHGLPNLKRGLFSVSFLWFCLFLLMLFKSFTDATPLSTGTLLFILSLSLLSFTAALRYRSRR